MKYRSLPGIIRYQLAVAFVPVWLVVTLTLMMISVLFQIVPQCIAAMVLEFAGEEERGRKLLDGDLLVDHWFAWCSALQNKGNDNG